MIVVGSDRQDRPQSSLHRRQEKAEGDSESAEIFGSVGLLAPHQQEVGEYEGECQADEDEVASQVGQGKGALVGGDGDVFPGEADWVRRGVPTRCMAAAKRPKE